MNQRLEEFELKFNSRLKKEENIRKNIEKGLSNFIENKFQIIKRDIIELSKKNDDKIEEINTKKEKKSIELNEFFHNEKKERINKDKDLKTNIDNIIKDYTNILKEEINQREEKDENILDNIKKGLNEFKNNLNKVKKERETIDNRLINLVEKTVAQIESKQNVEVISSI